MYNLVQVHIPHPIQLITFTLKSGRGANGKPAPIMLCCKQVHDLVMADTCSYRSFHSRATTVGSALVTGEDLQVMIRLEVVPPSTPQITAITVNQARTCLKPKALAPKLTGLTAIKLQSISMQVLPIPPHVMSATPMWQPSPTQLRVVEPFPVTIHQMQLPASVKKSYGLIATKPALAKVAPLHHQLDSLRVWCTTPIQTNRPGLALLSSTWRHHLANISLFLGHCHWFQGVAEPNLGAYLEPEKICALVSLKMAQKHSPDTLNHVLDTTEVVLKWWMAQPGGDHPSLPKAITWLQTLNKQVGRVHATHHTHGSTPAQDKVRQGASCRWQELCIGIRPQWWSWRRQASGCQLQTCCYSSPQPGMMWRHPSWKQASILTHARPCMMWSWLAPSLGTCHPSG